MTHKQTTQTTDVTVSKHGRPIINVDLDNVVYPFVDTLAQFIESRGRVLPKDPETGEVLYSQWEIENDWGMSTGEWRNWFRQGVEEGVVWYEGEPIEGAIEYLWKLSDAEFYIRIITHRLVHTFGHQHAITGTVQWLDQYNLPYRSISFLGDESKANYLGEVLVDDSLSNIKQALEKGQRGILFHSPHNVHDDISDLPNVYRAHNWKEVYELVKEHVPHEAK